jgi:3-phosphoshikimate 1-carboxyvinyltransferase
MGADIRAREDNYAPLEIRGSQLHKIAYRTPMASAQVKSAVLLAGLFADGVTSVTEPARTRDHTELALEEFGAVIEKQGTTVSVHSVVSGNGNGKLQARSLDIPGDLSSAVFFIAAASLLPESALFDSQCRTEPDAYCHPRCNLPSMGATCASHFATQRSR